MKIDELTECEKFFFDTPDGLDFRVLVRILELSIGDDDDDPYHAEYADLICVAKHQGQAGVGALLCEYCRDLYRYDCRHRDWYRWAVSRYEKDFQQRIYWDGFEPLLDDLDLALERTQQKEAAKSAEDDSAGTTKPKRGRRRRNDDAEALRSLRANLGRHNFRKSAVEFAIAHPNGLGYCGDWDDEHPDLLACPNALLDLSNGRVGMGRTFDRPAVSRCTATRFDPSARCPDWCKTLSQIFPDSDTRRYVHKFLGSACVGEGMKHFHIFHGEHGDEGKSLVIKTIAGVLGDFADSLPSSVLINEKGHEVTSSHQYSILMLRGLRMVGLFEPEQNQAIATAQLKSLTGGDRLAARGVYSKSHESFVVTARFILATNTLPRLTNPRDFATNKRIRVVPFTVSFVRDPVGPHQRRADPDLSKKLRAEGSGILNWLLAGYRLWRCEGLTPPPEVESATRRYIASEDRVGEFLRECTVTCEDSPAIPATDLYRLYSEWIRDSFGGRAKTRKNFIEELSGRSGIELKKDSHGKQIVLGLRIRED